MGSPPPPDPYLALGVAKDAAASAIKTQYRKLALKFHPDKVQDEAQKQAAADEFHKIQTAYEIVGDEDRRARYDAQCKLAQLRKDVMEKHGARGIDKTDVKTSPFKSSNTPDIPRSASFQTRDNIVPTYEERKPAYASTEYFDLPRASSRKTSDLERSSTKRSVNRDGDRKSTRTSTKDPKKSEREERSRRTAKDIRRERENKTSIIVDEMSSESDAYEYTGRRSRPEEDLRRSREYDRPRKSREEPVYAQYDSDDKSRKVYSSKESVAREYITQSRRRPEVERQDSERHTSTRDRIAYMMGRDGRPVVRSQPSDSRRSSAREYETKSSAEDFHQPFATETVNDRRDSIFRRPPGLNQSRSSPAEIKIPMEKPRSQSVQIDRDVQEIPSHVRRSETMPHVMSRPRESRRTTETSTPSRSSTLRQKENSSNVNGASTESFGRTSTKYRYGQAYADDVEYPTPDGYRTVVREPTNASPPQRYTRSPSPVARSRETERERPRPERRQRYASVSPQRPSVGGRTTSTTQYVYPRPTPSRENSLRSERVLYGEIRPSNGAPAATAKVSSGKYSPPLEGVRYAQREVRPENISPSTGYNYTRRPSKAGVSYSSRGDGNPTPVSAR